MNPLEPLPNSSALSRRRMLGLTGSALAFGCLPRGLHADDAPAADAVPAAATAPTAPAKPKKDPYADGILVDGEPPLPQDGAFCFAVLPDTQYYAEKYPDTYLAQTRWIVEQKERRRIAGVLHLGDITNNNTPVQWERAQGAMKVLEDAGLPYSLILGNHDYSANGTCKDRTTLFNDYFPVAKMKTFPHWGGTYDREPDRLENSFQFLEAAGRKFLILCLEFGPRADVLRWANEVAARYQDREAILLTHALVYYDDTRYDWKKFGKKQNWNPHSYVFAGAQDDVNDGQELWDKLLSRHENFILTLNGHVVEDGLGQVTTATPGGRAVPQILVNFQMRPQGGDGWLRLIEMRPDGHAQTYDFSPTRRQCNQSAQNQFGMKIAPIA